MGTDGVTGVHTAWGGRDAVEHYIPMARHGVCVAVAASQSRLGAMTNDDQFEPGFFDPVLHNSRA